MSWTDLLGRADSVILARYQPGSGSRYTAFASERIDTLKSFLVGRPHPRGAYSYHAVQGFLFCVACTPRIVLPSEWIGRLFGGGVPASETPAEADVVVAELLALYDSIFEPVLEGEVCLPSDCPLAEDPMANLDPASPVSQWSAGFNDAHQWLAADWARAVPPGRNRIGDEEMQDILINLRFFAYREAAEAFVAKLPGATLVEVARLAHGNFDKAMNSYARVGRARALRAVLIPAPAARRGVVGRNDPCLCGSGRKYKKCCGGVSH